MLAYLPTQKETSKPGFELFPVTHEYDQIPAMSSCRYASAVQIPWREGDRREPDCFQLSE